jgi:hypothetical protein
MITFRLSRHSVRRDVEIVEVWDGDRFLATITPGDAGDGTIRLVSKHVGGLAVDEDAHPTIIVVGFE